MKMYLFYFDFELHDGVDLFCDLLVHYLLIVNI